MQLASQEETDEFRLSELTPETKAPRLAITPPHTLAISREVEGLLSRFQARVFAAADDRS
jgi:hypothetical protein